MARASISLAPLTVLLVLSSISALNLPSPNALTQPDGILGGSNLTTAIINATTWNFASAPASSSEPNFLNSTSSADGEPICKGDSFGYLLDLTQCYDAIGRIIPSPGWSSFGDRGLGCDVQLPRRYSSSDGTCVVDIFHKDGATSDISSGQEVFNAAKSVLSVCGRRERGYAGGYVRDIGVRRNLVVTVSRYSPTVTCTRNSLPTIPDVGYSMLDHIPYNWYYQRFGSSKTKGPVDVILPKVYTQLAIPPVYFEARIEVKDKDGPSVKGRWWDLYTGAVAINAICVRQSANGFADVGGLTVTIKSKSLKLGDNPSLNTTNLTSAVETS